jgi:predicted CopG family antitoxin
MVKNLTIKEEAYTYLSSIKRENESFSDVILRLKDNQRKESILSLCGSVPNAKYLRDEITGNWK